MAYEIEIEHADRRDAAIVRLEGSPEGIAARLGEAYSTIGRYLREAGLERPEALVYARFLRLGRAMEVEAGFTVTEPVAASGVVQQGFLPECDVAHTLHVGPYEDLENAVNEVRRWIAANGLQAGDEHWEVYLSGPDESPPRTDVYVPLKSFS
jgi:effector-binding domain-containing protein